MTIPAAGALSMITFNKARELKLTGKKVQTSAVNAQQEENNIP